MDDGHGVGASLMGLVHNFTPKNLLFLPARAITWKTNWKQLKDFNDSSGIVTKCERIALSGTW